MRVLHVVSRSSQGGIYRVICDLFEVFAEDRAIELLAAVIAAPGDEDDFPFSARHVLIDGKWLRRFWRLRRLARQCDVVHLHGFTPWQALACWLARKMIVYTNHGLLGTGRRLEPHEHLKLLLMKLFLRHNVPRIVHVSHFMQECMAREYKVPARKCSIIHNCTRWQAMPPHFAPDTLLRIGFHGRFVSVKRLDRMLNVAALVARRQRVEVVLVGEGPLLGELIALAKFMQVPLRIESYTLQVGRIVSSFDVEVIPSQNEALGLSVLESLQTGHPTFVFADGGGCTEIFAAETSWFVCNNETEMAEKISSLQEEGTRRHALNLLEKLQQRIRREFSLHKFHEGYKAVYQELRAAN